MSANSPLTQLIIDLKVKGMTKDQIRKNYQAGKYRGASPELVKGYVNQHLENKDG